MINIRSVSDLRNYTDALKDIAPGSPVFLTKNGRGKYVVMLIDDYEKLIGAGTPSAAEAAPAEAHAAKPQPSDDVGVQLEITTATSSDTVPSLSVDDVLSALGVE